MNVTHISDNNSFKGYDARALKGLVLTDKNYGKPLKDALGNLHIDIYTPQFADKKINHVYSDLLRKQHILWGQDYITVLNTKLPTILFDKTRDYLKPVLSKFAQQLKCNHQMNVIDKNLGFHLRGGNFFVCKNGDKNVLLLGDKKSYISEDLLKSMYNVQEVYKIPQTDYHLDLSIRPLENGIVLVSDIGLTQKGFENGIKVLQEYCDNNKLSDEKKTQINDIIKRVNLELEYLKATLEYAPYHPLETTSKIIDALNNAGLKPIAVPGAYYRLKGVKTQETIAEARKKIDDKFKPIKEQAMLLPMDKRKPFLDLLEAERIQEESKPSFGTVLANDYYNNFINAFVHKEDGELHYITNESLLDDYLGITSEIAEETGFSTKKLFERSIENFVKKSNIHYLDKETTKKLFDLTGGIHCLAAEVVNNG